MANVTLVRQSSRSVSLCRCLRRVQGGPSRASSTFAMASNDGIAFGHQSGQIAERWRYSLPRAVVRGESSSVSTCQLLLRSWVTPLHHDAESCDHGICVVVKGSCIRVAGDGFPPHAGMTVRGGAGMTDGGYVFFEAQMMEVEHFRFLAALGMTVGGIGMTRRRGRSLKS